ncbi:hypothetical protein [Streptomyces sp. YKOK-I1]
MHDTTSARLLPADLTTREELTDEAQPPEIAADDDRLAPVAVELPTGAVPTPSASSPTPYGSRIR